MDDDDDDWQQVITSSYTVKPALVTTCNKQELVLYDLNFNFSSLCNSYQLNLYLAPTCLKWPYFIFWLEGQTRQDQLYRPMVQMISKHLSHI